MKLYYSPGACSLAPHIALHETGLPHERIRVELASGRCEDGRDISKLNPFGYVPVLELDDGRVLHEVPALLLYLADRKPEAELAPPPGRLARIELNQWLNFVATELHKTLGVLFNPNLPGEAREFFLRLAGRRLSVLAPQLAQRSWLLESGYTIADPYLYTVLRWSPLVDFDLGRWPVYASYMARVEARPAVQAALEAEALSPVAAGADSP